MVRARAEEECRTMEEAYDEGYAQGRADMKREIEEHSVFYSTKPIEDIVREARADAIAECIGYLKGIDNYVADMVEDIFKLKEQK